MIDLVDIGIWQNLVEVDTPAFGLSEMKVFLVRVVILRGDFEEFLGALLKIFDVVFVHGNKSLLRLLIWKLVWTGWSIDYNWDRLLKIVLNDVKFKNNDGAVKEYLL